jgi:hypothetical protein
MRRNNRIPPLIAVLLLLLITSVAFGQPQSPNFLMTTQTFSAGGASDSSTHFRLTSTICQWSVADTHASADYLLTSGFLVPSYGTAAGAFLVVNPLSLNYGEVHVDSAANHAITLSDTGYWNLQITGMQFSLGAAFHLVPAPDMPDTIYARSSRDYVVQFYPSAAGAYRDTLTITPDMGNAVRVMLEGTGTAPGIVVEPDTLLFGDLWIGRAAQDTFSVVNPGTADLHVDSIMSSNPVFPSLTTPFTVPRETSHSAAYGITLPDTLSFSGHLTVYSDAGEPIIFLSAHGIWTELHANPAIINLGSAAVTDTVDTAVTLTSAGNTFVRISAVHLTTNYFTVFQMPSDSLPAYGSSTVILRFIAQTVGTFTDTLVIENSVGNPVRIPLSVGVTAVDDNAALIPKDFFLDQNYPNPFNPSTRIRFGVPRSANVTIAVFDILGRKVATLASGMMPPGVHSMVWDCSTCPSGMYLIRMQTDGRVFMRKMLLMK